MTKQRRSFFVDDILHMVMPINDCKRKRSIISEDGNRDEEETSNKKIRLQNNNDEDDDNNNRSKHSKESGGTGDEESFVSVDSNSIDNDTDDELCASSSCLTAIHSHQNKKQRKPRTAFTDAQLNTLEKHFERQKYISVQERLELANRLHLSDTHIKTWYQNRRTKWKRQACLGLELFAGATLQQWIQRQPHLLAAAAAYRPPSDATSSIGLFGSALFSETKAAIVTNPNTHIFSPAALALYRQQ